MIDAIERPAMVGALSNILREFVPAEVAKAIAAMKTSFADADIVANQAEQIRQLRSEIEKLKQGLSSNQKHAAAIDRKLGTLLNEPVLR